MTVRKRVYVETHYVRRKCSEERQMDKRPSCTGTFTFLWIHTLREEPLHHFLFLLTQRSIPLSSIYIDNHGNPSEMDKEFQIPDHVLGWGYMGPRPLLPAVTQPPRPLSSAKIYPPQSRPSLKFRFLPMAHHPVAPVEGPMGT